MTDFRRWSRPVCSSAPFQLQYSCFICRLQRLTPDNRVDKPVGGLPLTPHRSHLHQSPISASDASNAVLRQTKAAQPLSSRLSTVQIPYRRPQNQSMASLETSHDVANTPLLSIVTSANFLIFRF